MLDSAIILRTRKAGNKSTHNDFRTTLEDLISNGAEGIYAKMVQRLDQMVLDVAAEKTGGNIMQMGRLLGVARNTLRAKLVNLDGDQQELLKAKAVRLAITPSSNEHS